ncbi:MAG: hypothetical protein SWJ54_11460 [Cyanobacteriota bacterium]|nr:hypothetical protein [Cyanobacteriota bacterium]
MNILSLVLSFLTQNYQTSEKTSIHSSCSFTVDSPSNLEEEISLQQQPFEYDAHRNSRNTYHPRFLPDFSSDNLSYLSSHPAIKPR